MENGNADGTRLHDLDFPFNRLATINKNWPSTRAGEEAFFFFRKNISVDYITSLVLLPNIIEIV